VSPHRRFRSGGIDGRQQLRAGLAPGVAIARGGQRRAVGGKDRAATQVGRHLAQAGHRGGGIGLAGNPFGRGVGHLRQHTGVSLARASWLTVVIACAIAALILAIDGYVGYPIVIGAVGASAAVNLL